MMENTVGKRFENETETQGPLHVVIGYRVTEN